MDGLATPLPPRAAPRPAAHTNHLATPGARRTAKTAPTTAKTAPATAKTAPATVATASHPGERGGGGAAPARPALTPPRTSPPSSCAISAPEIAISAPEIASSAPEIASSAPEIASSAPEISPRSRHDPGGVSAGELPPGGASAGALDPEAPSSAQQWVGRGGCYLYHPYPYPRP